MAPSHELVALQENLLQPGLIHGPQCGYLLQHGPLHVLQGNTCSTMVLPETSRGCRGISAPAPGAPSPLLLLSPQGLQCCFSRFFSPHSSLPAWCFILCQTSLQRCHSSAKGLSRALWQIQWSCLCQARGSPSFSSWRLSLQPHHHQNLDVYTPYTHIWHKATPAAEMMTRQSHTNQSRHLRFKATKTKFHCLKGGQKSLVSLSNASHWNSFLLLLQQLPRLPTSSSNSGCWSKGSFLTSVTQPALQHPPALWNRNKSCWHLAHLPPPAALLLGTLISQGETSSEEHLLTRRSLSLGLFAHSAKLCLTQRWGKKIASHHPKWKENGFTEKP